MSNAAPSRDTIICEAIEISDPAARAAYLDRACGSDGTLRRRVEALVAAHFMADGNFLEPPGVVLTAEFVSPLSGALVAPAEAVIGPYHLREQIGEGGMGLVFVAEQTEPVRRKVALKLIKPGMDTRQVVARFEAERQALALMDHPNIATVLDAGTTAAGHPFFVMELVKGKPITEHCDTFRLPVRARLGLFLQVCRAVQHAHQKGVIHRDIKPSNVLIAIHDVAPVAKVIDFGIAKAMGEALTDKTVYTAVAQFVGTPLYMSPEQVGQSSLDVDTRTDVYALGVLLYELLTGTTPIDPTAARGAGWDELRRVIREVEPARPSDRVSTLGVADRATVADRRGAEPRALGRQLRGELDWVVMRCLEKDRERRYESAGALAADVERYLANEPVEACPPSVGYRFRKFLRRNRGAAAAGLAVSTGVVVALGALTASTILTIRAYKSESQHRQKAEGSAADAIRARQDSQTELYATHMSQAHEAWENGDLSRARELLDRHAPRAGEADRRGFEWHYLDACVRAEGRTLSGHEFPLLSADLSPDGRLAVTADKGGVVKLWDATSGRELRTIRCSDRELACVRFSPNGKMLATAGQDPQIRVWAVADGSEIACLRGHIRTVTSVCWSPDGEKLVSGGRDNAVMVWDIAKSAPIRTLAGHKDVVRAVAWSPDGKLLASAGKEPQVRLWEAATLEAAGTLSSPGSGDFLSLAFSPKNTRLAAGGYGGTVFLYRTSDRKLSYRFAPSAGTMWSAGFDPDGRYLLGGFGDWLEVWDFVPSQMPRVRAVPGSGAYRAVAFSHDGRTLLTAVGEERVARVTESSALFGYSRHTYPGRAIDVYPEQGLALWKEQPPAVALRRYPSGGLVAPLVGLPPDTQVAACSRTGNRLVTSHTNSGAQLWDTDTGREQGKLQGSPQVPHYLDTSPDGTLVAGGDLSGRAFVWRTDTGERVTTMHTPSGGHTRVRFSPDGALLAVASKTGTNEEAAVLWRVGDWSRHAVLKDKQEIIFLAFSPDSRTLATCGHVRGMIFWDVTSGRRLATLGEQSGSHHDPNFSPDGRTLATLGADNSVRLWHVPTRRELFTLSRHTKEIQWIRFESNHRFIVGSDAPNGETDVFAFPPRRDEPGTGFPPRTSGTPPKPKP